MAAKERVLGLLAEKRRALITRAVTRGLDPAPLRDSGIPWLGEIPAHWETERAQMAVSTSAIERFDNRRRGTRLRSRTSLGDYARSEKDVNMFEAETN